MILPFDCRNGCNCRPDGQWRSYVHIFVNGLSEGVKFCLDKRQGFIVAIRPVRSRECFFYPAGTMANMTGSATRKPRPVGGELHYCPLLLGEIGSIKPQPIHCSEETDE
jgi:hypothetical protein